MAYNFTNGKLPLEVVVLEFAERHGLAPWDVTDEEPTSDVKFKWFEISLKNENYKRSAANGK